MTLYCFLSGFPLYSQLFGADNGEEDDVAGVLSQKATYAVDHLKSAEIAFSEGKGKIKFPKGSIDKLTNIDFRKVETAYDKKKFRSMGDMYRFGPHGLKFKKPVLLTLSYEEPEFPEEFIRIYYYNRETDTWACRLLC